jgi:hypothetical protein
VLSKSDCKVCTEWVPVILEPHCNKRNIELVSVQYDTDPNIIFPPVESPIIYFYVVGIEEPLIRAGAALEEFVVRDLDRLVKIANGTSINEAYGL